MRYLLLLATLTVAPRLAAANCETERTATKAARFALEREPDIKALFEAYINTRIDLAECEHPHKVKVETAVIADRCDVSSYEFLNAIKKHDAATAQAQNRQFDTCVTAVLDTEQMKVDYAESQRKAQADYDARVSAPDFKQVTLSAAACMAEHGRAIGVKNARSFGRAAGASKLHDKSRILRGQDQYEALATNMAARSAGLRKELRKQKLKPITCSDARMKCAIEQYFPDVMDPDPNGEKAGVDCAGVLTPEQGEEIGNLFENAFNAPP